MAVLGLSAIDQMFFIPAYPFWSLTIIAMDVVALYGLCAYGSRANLRSRLGPHVRDIGAIGEIRALIGAKKLRELHEDNPLRRHTDNIAAPGGC